MILYFLHVQIPLIEIYYSEHTPQVNVYRFEESVRLHIALQFVGPLKLDKLYFRSLSLHSKQ